MTPWILVLIAGISWAGPGMIREIEFDSKEDCHYALGTMIISGNNQVSGDDDEQTIAYCKPKK